MTPSPEVVIHSRTRQSLPIAPRSGTLRPMQRHTTKHPGALCHGCRAGCRRAGFRSPRHRGGQPHRGQCFLRERFATSRCRAHRARVVREQRRRSRRDRRRHDRDHVGSVSIRSPSTSRSSRRGSRVPTSAVRCRRCSRAASSACPVFLQCGRPGTPPPSPAAPTGCGSQVERVDAFFPATVSGAVYGMGILVLLADQPTPAPRRHPRRRRRSSAHRSSPGSRRASGAPRAVRRRR